MDLIWEALQEAFEMLSTGSDDVYGTAWRSILISGTATAISLVVGVAIGAFLAFARFPGRLIAFSIVNTGMGMPPIVVGLFVAILLWRSGPLGDLGWIYQKQAMIIAQAIIVTPIIAGFTAASLASLPEKMRLQIEARLQRLASPQRTAEATGQDIIDPRECRPLAVEFVHDALVAGYRPGRGRLRVLDHIAAGPAARD